MYSLRFAKTYDFGIMEKNNIKHVLEDKFYADDKMFCIADGVTRDFKDGTIMNHYPENMDDVKEILEKYPNPSGAAAAAEICVNDISKYFKEKTKDIKAEDFDEALKNANEDINKINMGREINYTSEDEYCCVAVGGVIENDKLKCFAIGDSGIEVVDKDYNVLFDTFNFIHERKGLFDSFFRKVLPKDIYRSYDRMHRNDWLRRVVLKNNFGVLNGNKKALDFVQDYDISLKNSKYVIVFSDGTRNLINTKEKLKNVINNPEKIRFEKCEKTLIIYENI